MIKFLYNWVGFLRGPFECLVGSFFSLMTMAAIDDSNPFILHSSDNLGIALVSHPFIVFSVDVVLWMNWRGAIAVLVYASALWYLFERIGYNFLSFVIKVFANKL